MKKYLLLALVTSLLFSCDSYNKINLYYYDKVFEYQSKEDLKRYSFIASVTVDSVYVTEESRKEQFYKIHFKVNQLFKGDSSINTVSVLSGNPYFALRSQSSCDTYIDKNDKLLLFAYKEYDSKLSTHGCTPTQYLKNTPQTFKSLRKLKRIYK
ncbi:hypothetical protein EI427_25600 (plasmid) [Flammeovirga pectinis]|uniref:Lipoprotein n=1 Tax=Flammeovirga pectinis TaxID=2494373 RepID=A0A3Q9FVQ0_9BACT|nr:hypothetical protein [Flammeovirga pectinis]AZQ65613.1 hypothetical protein EI427_25600 [Flammeovirga pectinis]